VLLLLLLIVVVAVAVVVVYVVDVVVVVVMVIITHIRPTKTVRILQHGILEHFRSFRPSLSFQFTF
jgi:hypothetical protein